MGAVYQKWKQALGASVTIDATYLSELKVVLVDSADYTVNANTHEFLSDIPAAGRVATAALPSATWGSVGDAVLDCADVTFSTVTGDPSELVVYYHDTGVEGTSRLISFDDNANIAVTPNGQDINLTINTSGIFKL